jgi:hypothetical protein
MHVIIKLSSLDGILCNVRAYEHVCVLMTFSARLFLLHAGLQPPILSLMENLCH